VREPALSLELSQEREGLEELTAAVRVDGITASGEPSQGQKHGRVADGQRRKLPARVMGRLSGLDAATIGAADRWEDEREPSGGEDDRQSNPGVEVAQRVKS
jgi:hypothetical protein